MDMIDKIIFNALDGVMYYEIRNQKNKKWLVRTDDLKNGFKLYQPTALKGIILKKFFPLLHRSNILKKILKITEKKIQLNKEIKFIFDEVFPKGYKVAIFGGTPSVHQKIVIQISSGNKILAYCKIANNNVVQNLFDKECDILNYLNSKGVKNVPKVIFRKNIDNYYLFCQSNVKTTNSRTIKKFKKYHIEFLKDMYTKTNRNILFEDTDYYRTLQNLKIKINSQNKSDRDVILNAIDKIEKLYCNKLVNFAFYHGDFTPWNMSIDNNTVQLFDFEYAQKTYPYYLDIFHFFLQTEIFVKRNNEEKILRDMKKINIMLKDLEIDISIYFCMYLLEIINLYLSRTDNETEEEKENIKLRINLLKEMVKINEKN